VTAPGRDRASLPHVLWIGGAPGAGKTTVGLRLARRYGLRLYSADTRTWVHRDRALAAGNAAAERWEALSPEERRRRVSPAELLAMSLHADRGAMVVDDLRALPAASLIVAEGSTLPAWVVAAGIADRSHTVWLIPTAALQRARLAGRATAAPQARLYLLLGELIAREASEHALPTLPVDGSAGIAGTTEAVAGLFADTLAAGPLAAGRGERRALLREANEAIAAQVRGYHTRPWARGDADTVVRGFACECGDRGCVAGVPLPVGALGDGPVLARDHGQDRDGAPRKSP
jgi:hypothetical protein